MERHFASLSLCYTAASLFPLFVYLCNTAKWWKYWNTCNRDASTLKSLLLTEFSIGFTLILCLNLYVWTREMTAMCHRCGKEREAGVYGKHWVCHWDPGATAAVPVNWYYNLESPIKERVIEEEESLKSMNSIFSCILTFLARVTWNNTIVAINLL